MDAREWIASGKAGYWQQLWVTGPGEEQHCCVVEVDGELFVSPRSGVNHNDDIGPYPTLEEAQAAAVVLHRMGAGPK